MAKHKTKKRQAARSGRPLVLDFQIRRILDEADAFIKDEAWSKARRLLQSLQRRAPAHLQVMEDLAYVYFQLEDWHHYVDIAERIRERTPERADIYQSLAGACLNAVFPFQAARLLVAFCARFPRHPEHDAATERLRGVRTLCADLIAKLRGEGDFPLDGEAAARFLENHEWMQVQMSAGRFAEAEELGEAMRKQSPQWPPLLNNLSLTVGTQGRHAEALNYAEQVLEVQPDHPFALAEAVKRLYLLGRHEEARTKATQAATLVVENGRDDAVVKLAEAQGLLGEDAALVDLHERAEAAGRPEDSALRAVFIQLVGSAQARLGNAAAARALWQEALEESPGLGAAEESLEDLDRPVEEQHGPFFLNGPTWFPWDWIEEMMEDLRGRKSEPAITATVRRFLSERPGLLPLLPALLDRGDEQGRIFAVTVCRLAETPETLAALRDFALGQHGTDRQRTDALMAVLDKKAIPRGPVKMWLHGEWREIQPLGFEITSEPLSVHPPHIQPLVERAVEALREDDLGVAEEALSAALALNPDAPDLLNNLALLRSKQGREAEVQALLKDIRERFPDYSFGMLNGAQTLLEEGKATEALDLIQPVLRRERLHITEFSTLCTVQVRALLALHKFDGARTWFQMLAREIPKHPMVRVFGPMFRQRASDEVGSFSD